jgi:hypothetical protein
MFPSHIQEGNRGAIHHVKNGEAKMKQQVANQVANPAARGFTSDGGTQKETEAVTNNYDDGEDPHKTLSVTNSIANMHSGPSNTNNLPTGPNRTTRSNLHHSDSVVNRYSSDSDPSNTNDLPSHSSMSENFHMDTLLLWVVGVLVLVSVCYCLSLVVRGKFDTLQSISTPFAVMIALMGYFFNYYVQKKTAEHILMQKRMVERIHDLYGPCLMLLRLNHNVFAQLGVKKAKHPFAVECLFHPINLKIQAKIMQHSQYIFADCNQKQRKQIDAFVAHVVKR